MGVVLEIFPRLSVPLPFCRSFFAVSGIIYLHDMLRNHRWHSSFFGIYGLQMMGLFQVLWQLLKSSFPALSKLLTFSPFCGKISIMIHVTSSCCKAVKILHCDCRRPLRFIIPVGNVSGVIDNFIVNLFWLFLQEDRFQKSCRRT